jgi:hypothetical protein
MLASADNDIGLVPARKATRKAKQVADATGKPVTVRDPLTDTVVATAKPKAKRKKQAKANGKILPMPQHRNDGPTGMTAKILSLASRPNGASRKELIDATGWKQQAWRWGFENKHGTGWCQRHGYTLKVIERKDGVVAYRVTKR